MDATEPVLTGHKGFRVAGRAARTSGAAEAGLTDARIPALWEAHRSAGGAGGLPGAMDSQVSVAVYSDYEADHLGRYTVLVGAPVTVAPDPVAELDVVEVPDASFLLFTARGSMPVALVETWQRVWSYFDGDGPYQRAYTADFEIHHHDDPERVDVYVAVR